VLLWSIVLGLLMAGSGYGVEVTFQDQSVVASGLTPGNSVVWFGVEHTIDDTFSTDLTQHYEIGTVAADGTAHIDFPAPPTLNSYWVAVDLGTGAYGIMSPGGETTITLPGGGVQPSLDEVTGSQSDGLIDSRPYLMGVLVRPTVGAWSFAGADGGPRDEDGQTDGHLRFALDGLSPLASSPAAPSKVDTSDLWFIVDPMSMTISVIQDGVAQ